MEPLIDGGFHPPETTVHSLIRLRPRKNLFLPSGPVYPCLCGRFRWRGLFIKRLAEQTARRIYNDLLYNHQTPPWGKSTPTPLFHQIFAPLRYPSLLQHAAEETRTIHLFVFNTMLYRHRWTPTMPNPAPTSSPLYFITTGSWD